MLRLAKINYSILYIIVVALSSCQPNNPNPSSTTIPQLITYPVSNTQAPIVELSGEVTNEGGAAVVVRGFCWATHQNPTVNDSFSINTFGIGAFSDIENETSLIANNIYYVRSYATNSFGTAYGNEVSFQYLGSGGIVFYIDYSGLHGLVCSNHLIGNYIFGCYDTLINTSDFLGSGYLNSQLIIQIDTTQNIAAAQCMNLSLNGFNDWFLPSKDELDSLLNKCSSEIDFSGNNVFLLSSSQTENFTNTVWGMSIIGQTVNIGKNIPYSVIAIRKF